MAEQPAAPPITPLLIPPSGLLSELAPEALMRWCEAEKFTGTLEFTSPTAKVTFPLMAGLVELWGPDDPLAAALTAMLAASSGSYSLTQSLPPIDSCERLGSLHLAGDLGPERVGDLMHYCEAAGLSGELKLSPNAAPIMSARSCIARYHRGELGSLTLDGREDLDRREDLDLSIIFNWTHGRWEIIALPAFVTGSASGAQAPEETLLRTFEVALAEVLEKSAQSRTPARRPPSLRPGPCEAKEPVYKLPPGAADTTIKVYFVKAAAQATSAPLPISLKADGEKEPEALTLAPPAQRDARRLSSTKELTREELALSLFSVIGLSLAVWLIADLLLRA